MPLLRTRPALRLRAPRHVVPGVAFEIAVLLDAKEEVDIDWCDVDVRGTLSHHETIDTLIPHQHARLCEARRLPSGTTALAARMTLPIGAPRSHPGRIVYDVAVHASVPWWPDARSHFALHVIASPTEAEPGRARIGVSHADVAIGTPYAELALGTDVFEIGSVIDGRAWFRDVGGARTTVSLASYEQFHGGGATRATAWSITLPSPSGPFALAIPADATPTFASEPFSLSYWLVAEARTSMRGLVSAAIPVRLVDTGGARSSSRLVAPHVGDTRLEELFAEVGATEGATVEPGPTLLVRRGDVEARASRELGADGTRIAVTMTYPDRHLGIHVYEPMLVALAPRARRIARDAGLSPRCAVAARDAEQAAAFLEALAAPLSRARSIDLNDTAARYVVATSANDRNSIGRVVREMAALAAQLGRTPPLPTTLQLARREWDALASGLGGTLEAGHARVIAATAECAIEIATLFGDDGVPNGTTVSTRPTRELLIDAPISLASEPLPDDLGVSAETRAGLQRLLHFGRIHVGPTEIRVTLDAPLGGALPPSRGREIVEASLRLAATLRASHGPFR